MTPTPPPANSLVPSANVVVVNEAGHILLIRRTDNDNWALPGGAMDMGESLVNAARRETAEETGVEVEITGLVGIYTDPRHVILYTSNGEVRQEFSVVFTARDRWRAHPEQRVARGSMDRYRSCGVATDGPVDADADQSLPGRGKEAPPWLAA